MNYLDAIDFESTIRDYEFTKKAQRQIHRAVTSETFIDMDAEKILHLLKSDFEIVSFKDYLKRYIYERAQINERFDRVPEEVYRDIIRDAFLENNVPHSAEAATTRLSAAVKSWLASDRVRRETVFLLGFALRMDNQDVNEFLTKVLKEDGFRENDPGEAVYSFCFQRGLPYARARELLRLFEGLRAGDGKRPAAQARENADEAALLARLLAGSDGQGREEAAPAYLMFHSLYARCQAVIANIYTADEEEKPPRERRAWQDTDITPTNLEQMLCSGIPLVKGGNLSPASQSLLSRHFDSYRLSRQRLSGLLNHQLKPDRYDLMTLAFFLHAQEDIPEEERLKNYLDEVNHILGQCSFGPFNAANPYEAFLLICTLSGCPLALFSEVWELSYPEA